MKRQRRRRIAGSIIWKIYAVIGVTVCSALLTVAFVYWARCLHIGCHVDTGVFDSIVIAGGAGSLVALAVGYWLAKGFRSTLEDFTAIAQSLTRGNYHVRLTQVRSDEFGVLAKTFNHLAFQLSERIAALSQQRIQLSAVFAGMVEAIVAISDDDTVLFANEAANRLLQTKVTEAKGCEISAVPGLGRLLPLVIQSRSEKRRIKSELAWGDGEFVLELETHAAPFKGEQCAGVVVVMHDVTELRRLERIRREFVANVSHELKTPLTSITAMVETLNSGAKDDPLMLAHFLGRIAKNTSRLTQLVSDILSLARIESTEELGKPSTVDLSRVIHGCMASHQELADQKQIKLEPLIEDGVVVSGDQESVRMVFDNLLSNALRYTPTFGTVSVSVMRKSLHGIAIVKDSGVGIAEEHVPRIFERFYRVDRHRSRDDGGTGLGLSIVKHLVHSLKGEISVLTAPGKGSQFTVSIPRHSN